VNAHQPELIRNADGIATSASCAAPNCNTNVRAGMASDEGYIAHFTRLHTVQYEPGRAPDIEVDWDPSANCSVCEDLGEVKADPDGEGLFCVQCKTRWGMDGEHGERAEAEEPA
jgi:hypothetical protein